MATRTLTVVLAGNSKGLERALGRSDGAFKKFGKAAGVAAVATGAAFAAIGAKGVQNAVKLEKGLGEVRTLLPDLTDNGFATLRDDVLAFSDSMGVATEQAVPALYQAISAGVPRENAITFLETATKAAVGGVTDLETAVDGITSVVNAYGADVLDATRASDLMFTAVKLGKTDFEQLSGSLFNVVPIAAAAGVKFEEVTAGLARLTAQGTPTSVATTQLRAAIQAVVAPSARAKVHMDALGLSFDEAKLAEIGLAGAFDELINATGGNLETLRKVTGSVEALQAVLALGGPNAAGYAAALAEMEQSAGATNAAFETMDQTFARKWEKTVTRVNNLITRLGIVLLPHVNTALDLGVQVAERAAEVWQARLLPALRGVAAVVGGQLVQAWASAQPVLEAVGAWITDTGLPALRSLGDYIAGAFLQAWADLQPVVENVLLPALGRLAEWARSDGVEALRGLAADVVAVTQSIGRWIDDNSSLVRSLGIAIGIVGAAVVAIKIAIGVVALLTAGVVGLGAVLTVLLSPVVLVTAAIVGVTAVLVHLYRTNEGFRSFVDEKLVPTLRAFGEFLAGAFTAALGAVSAFVTERVVPTLATISGWVRATGLPALGEFAGFLRENLITAFRAASEWIDTYLLPALRSIGEVLTALWQGVLSPLLATIRDASIAAFGAIVSWVREHWTPISTILTLPIRNAADAIRTVITAARKTLQGILLLIKGDWRGAWREISQVPGLFFGLFVRTVRRYLDVGRIFLSAGRSLGAKLMSGIMSALSGLASAVASAVSGAVSAGVAALPSPGDIAGDIIGGIAGSIPGFSEGGVVPGPPGAPRLAVVHGGEEVLTHSQRRMRGGAPQVYAPITIYATDADSAEDGVYRALESLARKGIIRVVTR